jgi:hypothetical protein
MSSTAHSVPPSCERDFLYGPGLWREHSWQQPTNSPAYLNIPRRICARSAAVRALIRGLRSSIPYALHICTLHGLHTGVRASSDLGVDDCVPAAGGYRRRGSYDYYRRLVRRHLG